MKTKGLDGKEYLWNPSNNPRQNASSYHSLAKEILQEEFPLLILLEEVSLPISRRLTLYADFYIPQKKILVEIQGQQHLEYVQLFHANCLGNKAEFLKGQKKDRQKKEWAELNDITYLALNYNEDINEWRRKIRNR